MNNYKYNTVEAANQNEGSFDVLRYYAAMFENIEGVITGVNANRLRVVKMTQPSGYTSEIEWAISGNTLIVACYKRNIRHMTVTNAGILQHTASTNTFKLPHTVAEAEVIKAALAEKIGDHLNEKSNRLRGFEKLKTLLAA